MKSTGLLLLALSTPFLRIQTQTTLSGTIHDGTGKPLPVSVALLNARDSSIAKGTVSDQ